MMKKQFSTILFAVVFAVTAADSPACTNILVTKGASKDGSTMVSYSADSHTLYGELYFRPAATYPKGTMMPVYEWDTGKYLGEIPQAEKTYSVVGNMNQHQLCIAETTFGGRREFRDSTGLIDYGTLIYTTLQRAKTAREAIAVMTSLVKEYGYCSTGESFSIADPNEVWMLEMIGKGTKMEKGVNANKGAVWVAVRIPDGYIASHANHARIMSFPMNDPQNCLYAPDVISFARKNGLYKGDDKDFSFSDVYAPLDFSGMRGCEARVWATYRKITDGMDQYLDYAKGHNPRNRMPLYVKPDRKLSVKDVADFMRDHYEDTPLDMRNDIGAGGHALPYRWRPMSYEVDGQKYTNERAIATQQTGFWFVSQSRSWLPDEIGGIIWFGVDDAATSCLTPVYSSSTQVPECFAEGNGHMTEYSPTSAFWLFNRVSNFAYLRYDMISADVKKATDHFENARMEQIPSIDKKAQELYAANPADAVAYLTDYSLKTAQNLFNTWTGLDRYLLVKYMDGNMKKEKDGRFLDNGNGRRIPASPDFPGYSDEWKKAVVKDAGERLKVVDVK